MVLVLIVIYLHYMPLKPCLNNVYREEKDLYSKRLHTLKNILNRKKIQAFLITDLKNICYLTGFSGSSGCLFLTKDYNFFITDFRYKEEVENEIRDFEIIIERNNRIEIIKKLVKKLLIKNLGFESNITFEFYERLKNIDKPLKPLKKIVERVRAVKDEYEISSIKKAVERAEKSFLEIKPFIKRGVTERAIMLRLEERLKKNGCRKLPFEIIVASGENSSRPHAKATDKRILEGEFLIIDWGGECNGYYSDMTRTFLIGGGNDFRKKRAIYNVVLEANKKAIKNISKLRYAFEIDRCAREVIEKAGFGEYFGHGTGHGVGLDVHEMPSITKISRDEIKENMVFTIEPGIYVKGIGGVRIEDMVLVNEKGCCVLTSLSKDLELI